MVTIKEIAKRAGVSPTTVSNVLNGRTQKVSPKTVKKIQKLLDEHNYVPRFGLNALRNTESKIIGILINTPEFMTENPLEKPFYSRVVGTLEKLFWENGYYTMICSSKDMDEIMTMVLGWNIDGVITISMPEHYYHKTQVMTKKPVVSIDMEFENSNKSANYYNVTSKDFHVGELMSDYLLKVGSEEIIFLANTLKGVDNTRYLGAQSIYQQVLGKDKKIERFILSHELEKREELYRSIALEQKEKLSLFFSTDFNAVEAIGFYNRNGIRIPDDISIVGCDDEIYSILSAPRLTTVRIDSNKKAELAGNMLLNLIQGKTIQQTNIEIDASIVERESVKFF